MVQSSGDVSTALNIAYSGMSAQSQRLKVIAQNLANVDSTSETPGGAPYRRKLVNFKDVFDRSLGADKVTVGAVTTSNAPFGRRYDPGNPGADADGYVKTANVDAITELMDMKEAQRSYDANLNVIDAAKSMLSRTIDLLHG